MSFREKRREERCFDGHRREVIGAITGKGSSKKTYYPSLKEKIQELEVSNELLRQSRAKAEDLADELHRAAQRTSSVLAATRHISRHLGLEEVLQEAMGVLTGLLDYPWASIHVFRDPSQHQDLLLETASESKFDWGGLCVTSATVVTYEGFQRARETGRPVCTAQQADECCGLVFLPIRSHDRTLAILTVATADFAPEALEVCEGVAQALVLAIENASLYRKVSSQAKRLDRSLEAISSISRTLTTTTEGVEVFGEVLVAMIEKLTGSQHVLVLETVQDDDAHELRPLWWTGRKSGNAQRHPASEVFTELHSAMDSYDDPVWLDAGLLRVLRSHTAIGQSNDGRRVVRALCVPMRRREELEGAIVAFFSSVRPLQQGELEILRIIGNQTATSLENANLYDQAEFLRREAEYAFGESVAQRREAESKNRELQRALSKIKAIEKQQIVQEERARIARELHDTVSQVLYTIGLGLDWCRRQAESDTDLQDRLNGLRQLAAECVTEIRQSIFDLASTNVTGMGLVRALERLAVEYPKLTSIELELDVSQDLPAMSIDFENELYRIVRESLFNVYKHSRASTVKVSVYSGRGDIQLLVEDDGVGMAQQQMKGYVQRPRHYGLRNMHERTKILGGYLAIKGDPGAGTTVEARVPVKSLHQHEVE